MEPVKREGTGAEEGDRKIDRRLLTDEAGLTVMLYWACNFFPDA